MQGICKNRLDSMSNINLAWISSNFVTVTYIYVLLSPLSWLLIGCHLKHNVGGIFREQLRMVTNSIILSKNSLYNFWKQHSIKRRLQISPKMCTLKYSCWIFTIRRLVVSYMGLDNKHIIGHGSGKVWVACHLILLYMSEMLAKKC